MAEMKTLDMETALDVLGREAASGSPRPGPDLMARVLADAAAIGAPTAQSFKAERPVSAPTVGIMDRLFGWTGGAVATMVICFAIGVGVGMELDVVSLPMIGEPPEQLLFAESDFLQEEAL